MKRALSILITPVLCLLFYGLVYPDQNVLVWSTLLGGSGDEFALDIAIDQAGDLYVTGYTQSPDFPITSGAYDTTFTGNYAIYVAKIKSAGNVFDYATFLCSGPYISYGYGVDVDDGGCAYVTGGISTDDLSTTSGAFDPTYNGQGDLFIAKLNAVGSELEYCTYLGGSETEEPGGIAIDQQGCVYVTGWTWSSDFPTIPGSFDTMSDQTLINTDVFISKISPSGQALEYSTFLGGMNYEVSGGIAVDEAGHAYVTGDTRSANFPVTVGAFDSNYNGGDWGQLDAFVSKLNPKGTDLIYSTYLGSTKDDVGFDISVSEDGAASVIGQTNSQNFPTTAGTFSQTLQGGFDAFLVTFDALGADLIHSTLFGGTGDDNAIAFVLDGIGAIAIIGETYSNDLPLTPTAFDTICGVNMEVYVAKFNALCSALEYASYLGGDQTEFASGISLDDAGNIYVTGQTGSPDFPTTPGALDTICSNYDGFITKLNLMSTSVSSEALAENLILTCILHPNHPNPFNASTEIRYQLPREADVSLRIYNVAGQTVRTLIETHQPAGLYTVAWDGTDDAHRGVASGIYFCRLQAGGAAEAIKMALVR